MIVLIQINNEYGHTITRIIVRNTNWEIGEKLKSFVIGKRLGASPNPEESALVFREMGDLAARLITFLKEDQYSQAQQLGRTVPSRAYELCDNVILRSPFDEYKHGSFQESILYHIVPRRYLINIKAFELIRSSTGVVVREITNFMKDED